MTEPSSRRARTSKPKVKSGCLTCKGRHVKCDEGKPFCTRCITSGWKCDGYLDPFRQQYYDGAERPLISLDMSTHATSDRRYDFNFRQYIAVRVSSPLYHELWMRTIPLLSNSLPGVRYAMLALSSEYDTLLTEKGSPYSYSATNEASRYSSQQYGKAIKRIIRILDSQVNFPDALLEILVTCLLLISYELLRGHEIAALTHLDGAIYLCSLPVARSRDLTPVPLTSTNTVSTFMDSIESAFEQLELQATTFIGARIPRFVLSKRISSTSASHLTLKVAKDSLSTLQIRVFQFIRYVAMKFKYHQPKPTSSTENLESALRDLGSAIDQRIALLRDLQEWESSFGALIKEIGPTNPSCSPQFRRQNETNSVLLLSFLTTFIMLSTSLEPDEAAYDLFFAKFKKIVTIAEGIVNLEQKFLDRSSSRCSSWEHRSFDCSPFQLDMSVIYPLYLTSLKCRDHGTRVHSLNLLRRSGREGVWDGKIMALVAECVISYEETTARNLYSLGLVEEMDLGDQNQILRTIPEFARVHGAGVHLDKDRRKIKLSCSRRIPHFEIHWEHLEFTLVPCTSDFAASATESAAESLIDIKCAPHLYQSQG